MTAPGGWSQCCTHSQCKCPTMMDQSRQGTHAFRCKKTRWCWPCAAMLIHMPRGCLCVAAAAAAAADVGLVTACCCAQGAATAGAAAATGAASAAAAGVAAAPPAGALPPTSICTSRPNSAWSSLLSGPATFANAPSICARGHACAAASAASSTGCRRRPRWLARGTPARNNADAAAPSHLRVRDARYLCQLEHLARTCHGLGALHVAALVLVKHSKALGDGALELGGVAGQALLGQSGAERRQQPSATSAKHCRPTAARERLRKLPWRPERGMPCAGAPPVRAAKRAMQSCKAARCSPNQPSARPAARPIVLLKRQTRNGVAHLADNRAHVGVVARGGVRLERRLGVLVLVSGLMSVTVRCCIAAFSTRLGVTQPSRHMLRPASQTEREPARV